MALGIDVFARYQNVTNWNAVRQRGVGFVWVKLTDGGGRATNPGDGLVAGAKSVGIPVGGYHFAQLSPSPEQQADVFIAEVRRLGADGLVPVVDIEAPFAADAGARDFGIRFCRRVAALGYKPGVYMNNAFAEVLKPSTWDTNPVIWIARYGARPSAAAGPYSVHQYSSSGSIPGISGSVDLNESYVNNFFNAHLGPAPEEDDMFTDEDRRKLNGLYEDASNTYLATNHATTQGAAIAEMYQQVKWMASVLGNTPDMDGDGTPGDVSLSDYRQFLVDQLKKIDSKLDAITPGGTQ